MNAVVKCNYIYFFFFLNEVSGPGKHSAQSHESHNVTLADRSRQTPSKGCIILHNLFVFHSVSSGNCERVIKTFGFIAQLHPLSSTTQKTWCP